MRLLKVVLGLATYASAVLCIAAAVAWAASPWRADRVDLRDWRDSVFGDPGRDTDVWLTGGRVAVAVHTREVYFRPGYASFFGGITLDGFDVRFDDPHSPADRPPEPLAACLGDCQWGPAWRTVDWRTQVDSTPDGQLASCVNIHSRLFACPLWVIVGLTAVLPAVATVRRRGVWRDTWLAVRQCGQWAGLATPALAAVLVVVVVAYSLGGRVPAVVVARFVTHASDVRPVDHEVEPYEEAKHACWFGLGVRRGRVEAELWRGSPGGPYLDAESPGVSYNVNATTDATGADSPLPLHPQQRWQVPMRSVLGLQWRSELRYRGTERWAFASVPGGYLLAGLATTIAAQVYRRRRRTRWAAAGRCRRCGYDLRASPDRCPECGTGTVVGESVATVSQRSRADVV